MKHRLAIPALAAVLLCSALAASPGAMAQVSVNIGINVPPPAPVYEVVPAPRPGYVWTPGYWDWNDRYHKHAWKQGYWVAERPGYVYESPRWVQASNGWLLVPGRWDDRRGPDRRYDREHDHHRGHDHDRYDDYDHGRHGGGRYHCPPGHAKKGEC